MKNKAVKTYFTAVAYSKLAQEAHLRNKSLSETIQACLQEYLDIRREMATAFEVPGKMGEVQSGKIIHTLLGRTEVKIEEIISGLNTKIDLGANQLNLIVRMIDSAVLLLLQQLVAHDSTAKSRAQKTHAQWRSSLER